ncbi:MAG TPA: sulfatase-like hydrolase/transferase [Bryobacteraceae bacterium]|nr:sulfatase-like hydrolase/transferase [Bryobacteraceae bacterium]
MRRSAWILGALLCLSCGKGPQPRSEPAELPFRPYRFDDHLSAASVSAPALPSAARVAEPVVWHNFFSESDLTWVLLRGRMGFRKGDMMLKGENNTPVIVSPKEPAISWGFYEAVQIRMLAEGGSEIKIRIGDQEFRQPLGPPGRYNIYRFEVNIEAPAGSRPLMIMPTDSLNDVVAISSIELIPRRTSFPQAAGHQMVGKNEEYRSTLYVHSPSQVTYQVTVPKDARLHFGLGIAERNSPVTFRVLAGGSTELYSSTVTDASAWQDADVDLSPYAGRSLSLTFATASDKAGAVGLWANPLLTTRAPKRRPNVLVYMIDTLRADHTSLYGYARDTTPFLRKLGVEGLVFEDCTAQATWTKPSTASLMTSLYSYAHGLVHDYDVIPKGSATLAEQLRRAGYVTASLVGNPFVGRLSGLQRGFDYLSEWAVIERHRTDAEDRATDSAALNRALFPWLEQHRDEPFFLYAHTTDPHAPYRPPAGFEEKFANPAETDEFNRNYAKLRDQAQYGGGTVITRAACARSGVNPDRFIRQAMDRYDGEILHNDASLEQLAGKLRQLGILDNTLIVVVSDHGEEFWDHGWTAHGHSLYQELTHTVLLLWNPALIRQPRRISEPVQLIDVMPTVLDLLGLPIPNVAEGQSLAPLAQGRPFTRRGPVVSSRYPNPNAKPNGFVPENRTGTVALLDASWKLIYRDKARETGLNRVELYDRHADRTDARNIVAANPQQVDHMMSEIQKWLDAQKQIKTLLGSGAKATIDPQTLEKLRSLGYIGGSIQP